MITISSYRYKPPKTYKSLVSTKPLSASQKNKALMRKPRYSRQKASQTKGQRTIMRIELFGFSLYIRRLIFLVVMMSIAILDCSSCSINAKLQSSSAYIDLKSISTCELLRASIPRKVISIQPEQPTRHGESSNPPHQTPLPPNNNRPNGYRTPCPNTHSPLREPTSLPNITAHTRPDPPKRTPQRRNQIPPTRAPPE